MNNIIAIFKKQLKDTLKNKAVLIQFVMFPIMTLIMNNAVKMQDMPENFFVNLFATMYIGMVPLTSMASIISEEKENGYNLQTSIAFFLKSIARLNWRIK